MSEFKEVVIGDTFGKTDDVVRYYTKYDDTGAFLYLGIGKDVLNLDLPDGTVVYSKTLNRKFDAKTDLELVVERFTPAPPNEPFGNTTYLKIFLNNAYRICDTCSLKGFKKNGDNYELLGDMKYIEYVGNNITFITNINFNTDSGVLYYKYTLPDQNGGKRIRVNKTRQRSKKNKRRSQRRQRRR